MTWTGPMTRMDTTTGQARRPDRLDNLDEPDDLEGSDDLDKIDYLDGPDRL